jgi:hypothetical protein
LELLIYPDPELVLHTSITMDDFLEDLSLQDRLDLKDLLALLALLALKEQLVLLVESLTYV